MGKRPEGCPERIGTGGLASHRTRTTTASAFCGNRPRHGSREIFGPAFVGASCWLLDTSPDVIPYVSRRAAAADDGDSQAYVASASSRPWGFILRVVHRRRYFRVPAGVVVSNRLDWTLRSASQSEGDDGDRAAEPSSSGGLAGGDVLPHSECGGNRGYNRCQARLARRSILTLVLILLRRLVRLVHGRLRHRRPSWQKISPTDFVRHSLEHMVNLYCLYSCYIVTRFTSSPGPKNNARQVMGTQNIRRRDLCSV
jgi:hypothetical protein